ARVDDPEALAVHPPVDAVLELEEVDAREPRELALELGERLVPLRAPGVQRVDRRHPDDRRLGRLQTTVQRGPVAARRHRRLLEARWCRDLDLRDAAARE